VGCLTVLALSSAEASSSTTYVWASLAAASVLPPNVYPLIPHTYGYWRDPERRTRGWVFAIVLPQFVACIILLAGNMVIWRAAWPLTSAFSIQVAYGLFLFARILIVRRWAASILQVPHGFKFEVQHIYWSAPHLKLVPTAARQKRRRECRQTSHAVPARLSPPAA